MFNSQNIFHMIQEAATENSFSSGHQNMLNISVFKYESPGNWVENLRKNTNCDVHFQLN